jgi:transcriptional regulator NrdR family protein
MQMIEESMKQIVLQEMNEERFNRKHIDAKIRKQIEQSPEMQAKVEDGVRRVNRYIDTTYSYASKNLRIEQIKGLCITDLVMDMFIGVAYCLRPVLFTSITAQMASRLRFNDKTEAITTVAELLAVLCQTDAFDIFKAHKMASLELVSCIPLGQNLVDFIEGSQYLPPMVVEPLELTHNYSSGYLTHNDSLILGQGNHHDGDLCLDTLNIMNKVPLKLDLQFLSQVEEEPTFALDTQEKTEQWARFKKQSYVFYDLMRQHGNRFHLTHKVDKRGRSYACGYHISSQGAPFKKAMLEFHHEEIVEGVPGL